jgi:UDPglucose 6-dehydrogenase
MKIAVIGTGYVGLVSGTCFAEVGHEVVGCDIDETKIARLNEMDIPIYEPGLEPLIARNARAGRLTFTTDIPDAVRRSDIIFIAVGTPMSPSGEADLQYVFEAARTIGKHMDGYKIVVTKSTVPVGTSRVIADILRQHAGTRGIPFDVASNPEFLREGSAVRDCLEMERAVIGATSERAARIVAELHKPFRAKLVITSLESAEMIKYASNAFLATKISFINSIANLCEKLGADVVDVARGMGMDSRIGPKFLQAGIGYGGSCFPKDTKALLHLSKQAGAPFDMLESVIRVNEAQRFRVLDKLEVALETLRDKRIAVLGLTFKPNTNDLREAPSLDLIPRLVEMGAKVRAYDAIAVDEARFRLPGAVAFFRDPYEAIEGCDGCLILTEWTEVAELDWKRAKGLMAQPVVVDGRNCLDPAAMTEAGFRYYSIGRSDALPKAQAVGI